MKQVIRTPDAPGAIGAYSQGTTDGNIVFTAGQIPVTPEGEHLDGEPIDVQTRQCLENIKAVIEEEGLSMQSVLKVTVYLDDIEDFESMNEAYTEYFRDNPPARSAVGVDALPNGAAIEIEAVATTR
jgi:reactive intermediate/imine deaminase